MATRDGASAAHVSDIPTTGWWDIIKRVYTKMGEHNLSLIAAGVAFYFLLAVFPLLAGLISLYGLLVSPDELQSHMGLLVGMVPADSSYIIEEQLRKLTEKSSTALGWGFAASLLLTLWSSSKGANALIIACNITYNEPHARSLMGSIMARIILTIGIIFTFIAALLVITILPNWLSQLAGPLLSVATASWLTWPILMLVFNVGLSSLYRYGPHRAHAKWRWVTPGSIMATVLWLLASFAFSFYLREYATYNETYGSVGGIIILLMWFYLTAFIVLLGAEFNSATELQTDEDSTTGPPQPKGQRGAFVADHTPQEAHTGQNSK